MKTTIEQKKRILKAKVTLALFDELGRDPSPEEVEHITLLTRVMYKAVLGTHYLRKQQQKTGQMPLF